MKASDMAGIKDMCHISIIISSSLLFSSLREHQIHPCCPFPFIAFWFFWSCTGFLGAPDRHLHSTGNTYLHSYCYMLIYKLIQTTHTHKSMHAHKICHMNAQARCSLIKLIYICIYTELYHRSYGEIALQYYILQLHLD